ncbi:MAG TPA: alpha/beta hydrolase [Clostridiaceae bacterium]|nr:alpha/beta hydrolase [Clostridiaceae bacterium]
MKRINNISYADKNGFRGLGDLFLPDNQEGAPVALVIHGGSWNAMDKTSITPLAILIAECGYAVFNINYRLLDDAPWPACGDDCIAAANFLLQAVHPVIKQLDHSKIVVAGASAGGHLALWTGLHLPPENVRAIISIAGPADLNYQSKNQVCQ